MQRFLTWFVARRLSRGRRGGVMVRIASVAVALSVAVMIVALAVVGGFKREISERARGVAADVQISSVNSDEPLPSVAFPGTPYAVRAGVAKSDDALAAVVLKGVDERWDSTFFARHLIAGTLPGRARANTRKKEILISASLAAALPVQVGGRVQMLFLDERGAPRRDLFKVAGIYATGIDELDKTLIITDLRNVQRLNGWSSEQVSGYEISTPNAAAVARSLNEQFVSSSDEALWNVQAVSVEQLHPELFDWLRTHDVNAAVVLSIMLIVALFNVSTALLILVLEQTATIGVLKTLGMRSSKIGAVFLWRAAGIMARGMLWGNAVGLGLCWLQGRYHVIKLDASGYLLGWVPVSLEWSWWVALNAGTLLFILGLLVLPASLVSRIRPEQTIRWKA